MLTEIPIVYGLAWCSRTEISGSNGDDGLRDWRHGRSVYIVFMS